MCPETDDFASLDNEACYVDSYMACNYGTRSCGGYETYDEVTCSCVDDVFKCFNMLGCGKKEIQNLVKSLLFLFQTEKIKNSKCFCFATCILPT